MKTFEVFARKNRKTDDKQSVGFVSAVDARSAAHQVTRNNNGLWISVKEVSGN
jgi:hypothetical protein